MLHGREGLTSVPSHYAAFKRLQYFIFVTSRTIARNALTITLVHRPAPFAALAQTFPLGQVSSEPDVPAPTHPTSQGLVPHRAQTPKSQSSRLPHKIASTNGQLSGFIAIAHCRLILSAHQKADRNLRIGSTGQPSAARRSSASESDSVSGSVSVPVARLKAALRAPSCASPPSHTRLPPLVARVPSAQTMRQNSKRAGKMATSCALKTLNVSARYSEHHRQPYTSPPSQDGLRNSWDSSGWSA